MSGEAQPTTGQDPAVQEKLTGAERARRWRIRHPERYLKSNRDNQRRRKERDPEGVREYERLRSARRYRDDPDYREAMLQASSLRQRKMRAAPVDAAYAIALRQDPCAYCGGPGGQHDHIVPLAQGGEHTAENLTGACASCNGRKSVKSLLHHLLEV